LSRGRWHTPWSEVGDLEIFLPMVLGFGSPASHTLVNCADLPQGKIPHYAPEGKINRAAEG